MNPRRRLSLVELPADRAPISELTLRQYFREFRLLAFAEPGTAQALMHLMRQTRPVRRGLAPMRRRLLKCLPQLVPLIGLGLF